MTTGHAERPEYRSGGPEKAPEWVLAVLGEWLKRTVGSAGNTEGGVVGE